MNTSYGFKQYVKEIFTGSKSLIIGMGITFKHMFRPIVTVQYPRQKPIMTPHFRGHIEAILFDDTKSHHCVACGLCARTCPSHVIKVQGEKTKAGDRKYGKQYFIDFTKCSLCGLCVDVCPEKTLKFSDEYELAFYSRWDGVMDIMQRLEERK
ncbi:NuoI/complex I 23 kDa subunit family protein [Desulfobacterium sp. N47]|uniref:NADH-quinone oxidoreductase subunit I n=1 Tax=uncultured Desulfobacterium sp. TaxID=201089 RepID=E1YML1_9BACT|nr:NADH-quinone oxidoreductase subunit I 1 [uncultured Desulfobacterium sp.]